MKKIISGKLYDTETAKEIGRHFYGDGPRDFRHYTEILYRKRTGEYFIWGEGGPMSRYSKSVGMNEWTGSERITPMDYKAAREWAEEHMDADDYQAEFGEVSEGGDERTVLSISLDAATADRIRKQAQEAGISISALIASKF
jgi:hypothetical protein